MLTTQGVMAREVLLPQVFRAHRFEKVLAYSQSADQAGAVLGPVVAAALLGWWRWEVVVCVAAGGFLLADLAMTLWNRTSQASLIEPEAAGSWALSMKTAFAQVAYLPGLRRLVILAAGVNMVVGATLASSAALVTGAHRQSAAYYAGLQTAGAIAPILVLLAIAHSALPPKRMGVLAFILILTGGILTATGRSIWVYAAGFLLIVGFDKMFNIYIRSSRQKIIPPGDYGKTTGLVVLLNNLTQPLAGLAIALCSGFATAGTTVLALTALMGLLGVLAVMSDSSRAAVVVQRPQKT